MTQDVSNAELKVLIEKLTENKLDKSALIILDADEISYLKNMIAERKAIGRLKSKFFMAVGMVFGSIIAFTDWVQKFFELLSKGTH